MGNRCVEEKGNIWNRLKQYLGEHRRRFEHRFGCNDAEKHVDIRKYRLKYGIGIAVIILVLAGAAIHTQQRIERERAELAESQAAERRRIEEQESVAQSIAESVAESVAARESEKARIDGLLEGEVREAYQKLFEALSDEKYGEAADCLYAQEDILESFYETTLGGECYLYDGESLKKEDSGYGLLVNQSGIAYLGDWKNGLPDGEGTAIRVLVLDDIRYDLSSGGWKEGKMNGDGVTGYCYYNGVEEPRIREIWKKGTFEENLMSGEIAYSSINAAGEEIQWKILAEGGKTVVDERWTASEENTQFRLSSETSDLHDYVLQAGRTDEVMWKNMVEWKK